MKHDASISDFLEAHGHAREDDSSVKKNSSFQVRATKNVRILIPERGMLQLRKGERVKIAPESEQPE